VDVDMSSAVDSSFCGFGLNTAQRVAVKASIARLGLSLNLGANSSLTLFGRIRGQVKDYLLLQATTVGTAIEKSYFFSTDGGVTFSKLPDVDQFVRERSAKVRGAFTGNPAKKYRNGQAAGDEKDEDEEDEEAEEETGEEPGDEGKEKKIDPSKRRLTELERVAAAAEAMDRDTAVVPRGAFFMSATGEIHKNDAFLGLNPADAQKLSSYQLFRAPADARTLAAIRKGGVSNNFDFLDSLNDVKSQWSLLTDDSGTVVSLRSLAWLGFEFRLEVASQRFCGAYFGHGERNTDLAFMQ